jgi:hypothetical protein
MLKNKITAVVVAAAIGLAPIAASAQGAPPPPAVGTNSAGAFGLAGCVVAIMIAAIDKGNKYKKELTTDEALTCGVLYWVKEANRRR